MSTSTTLLSLNPNARVIVKEITNILIKVGEEYDLTFELIIPNIKVGKDRCIHFICDKPFPVKLHIRNFIPDYLNIMCFQARDEVVFQFNNRSSIEYFFL